MFANFGYLSLFFFAVAILFFIFASNSRKQADQGTVSAQITIAIILLALSLICFLARLSTPMINKGDSYFFQQIEFFVKYIA